MTQRIDKVEALVSYLEGKGVRVRRGRLGYQQVSCFNEAAHPRGDRRPSASVDLTRGRYRCFSCDTHGDVIDLLMAEKSLTYKQALASLGVAQAPESRGAEEVWI